MARYNSILETIGDTPLVKLNKLALPVIDYATLNTPATLRSLDSACRDWGAFQLVGVDEALSRPDSLWRVARQFFEQAMSSKQQCERSSDNPWGYLAGELTLNTRDWKEVYDYGPDSGDHIRAQWPVQAGFRDAVTEHYAACEALAWSILGAISENLGVSPETTAVCFQPEHTSFLRLNYYPPCPQPLAPDHDGAAVDGALGVNPHTDAGALTILTQDQHAGLEIYREGRWYAVGGDSLVINIGDIVQVWSNDRYRAPLHRVVASEERTRLSAPWFFNPNYDAVYQPLPSMVNNSQPPLYRPINWGEFRSLRAAGDYADYGTEVQISQYRLAAAAELNNT